MGWRDLHVDVNDMIGKTFSKVTSDSDIVTFSNDEVRYTLYHNQDCCETVEVEDIIGDLEDLIGWPMLVSREDSNADGPELNKESYTCTL